MPLPVVPILPAPLDSLVTVCPGALDRPGLGLSETDREHMAFMDNAIRYQASLNFLNGRIQGLKLALRGE